jgi:MoaA/NifB/PqqE/SkfB family radical SAM enzyme
MSEVASPHKIAYHREKLERYLRGDPIFPATLELDITSQCTRTCDDCPSSRSPERNSLSLAFIRNLFASLEGETKGLLLTGGEATSSPIFPAVLAMAKAGGFEEIAVVTNGSLLGKEAVAEALAAYASTIRISMYDWGPGSCDGIRPTLDRIERLRSRIDGMGSPLKIGISALTSQERASSLPEVAEAVRSAGAHWIYFHPMCVGWGDGNLQQLNQEGVLDVIDEYRRKRANGFGVFASPSRYTDSEIIFEGYHAAHFLLVIGADGKNYLGAEVKYQSKFAIADVARSWRSDFLRAPERLRGINAISSSTYSALGSRHRGVLYNDFVERMKAEGYMPAILCRGVEEHAFLFPNIL